MRTRLLLLALLCVPSFGWAGRGSSPRAIRSAIASGSVDAIQSELERAEHLVCAVCVDYVLPLVDHADARVRKVAAWWLARRGVRRDLASQMIARLGTHDSTPARNAADVLGELRMTQAIPALAGALGNGQLSVEARVAAAAALGSIGDPAGAGALLSALSAPEAEVRAAALAALRQLRGFDRPEAAVASLSDGNEAVRIQAIYVLGTTRSPAGVSELTRLLESDPSATVRKKAAWALGEIGQGAAAAASALAQAAQNDASPLVRSLAQAALGRLHR